MESPMPAITTTQKRLNQLTYEVANAKKLRDLYVKNMSSKRYYWIKRYDTLINEQRALQGKSTQGAVGVSGNQDSAGQPVNREQIKRQIITANNNAIAKDTQMRTALKNKQSDQANAYRQQRDQFNNEVKRLQGLLKGSTATNGTTSQATGGNNKVAKPLTPAELKRYNTLKNSMKYWRNTAGQEKNIQKYQTEFNDLENRFNKSQAGSAKGVSGQGGATDSTGKSINREQLKIQIADANKKAQAADTDMRNALKSKQSDQANAYRQQRDQFNNEVKRLQGLLNGTTATNGATGNQGEGDSNVIKPLTSTELKRYNTLKNSMKYWRNTAGQEKNIEKHEVEFNDLENRINQSQNNQVVQSLSSAELKEYTRLKSSMDWWKSKNEVKNIQNNKARYDALKYRYEKTKGETQGATGVQGAAGPKGQAGIQGSAGDEDIVTKARNAYLKNTNLPDNGHNPILVHLLLNDFSEEKVKSMELDNADVEAYQVLKLNPVMKARAEKIKDPKIRQATLDRYHYGATGAPQVVAGIRFPVSELKGTDFFIRDYLQVQGSGGSKDAPWQVSGLTINDGAQISSFQKRFDDIVREINKGISKEDKPLGLFRTIAHRDAIQLIPVEYRNNNTLRIDQKLGATMRYIEVNDNKISSVGELQGIFATDGIFQELSIVNNTIDTQGGHHITIVGMLSGTIDGNKSSNGLLPESKIKLHPVRVGGELNIYIMGFNNKKGDTNHYAYIKPIKGKQKITDLRDVHPSTTGATFWKNVHIPTLQSTSASLLNRTLTHFRQVRDKLTAELKAAEGDYSKRNAIKTAYQAKFENVVSEMMKRAGGSLDK